MNHPVRHIFTAMLSGVSLLAATPARADDEGLDASAFTVSGGATLASDYRFRGVSRTGGDPALQGTITVSHDSGVYAGMWASNVDFRKLGPAADARYGETEVDIYGGWSGRVGPWLLADVGLLYYAYPGGNAGPTDLFEPYAALSATLGPARLKLGANYAWKQSSIGSDNLYVYADLDVAIPTTPLSVMARLGYSDGPLAPPAVAGSNDRTGMDYSLGVSASVLRKFTLGVSYVGTQGPSVADLTDDALVGTLSFNF